MGHNNFCGAEQFPVFDPHAVRGDHQAISRDKLAECGIGAYVDSNSVAQARQMRGNMDLTGLAKITLVDGSGKPVDIPPEIGPADLSASAKRKIHDPAGSLPKVQEPDLKKRLLGVDDGLGRAQVGDLDGR